MFVSHTALQCDIICILTKRVPVMQNYSNLSYLLSLCLSLYMQYNTNFVYFWKSKPFYKQIYNVDAFYLLKPAFRNDLNNKLDPNGEASDSTGRRKMFQNKEPVPS